MLLEFIVRYYKVFWIVFGMIAFVKVIFAYVFHGGLQGINGVIFALFKWFNEEEQEIEDVDLEEFSDEIESWVIEALKNIGCDTAKSVLALNREELIRRSDLEEETIDDVLKILASEFED